MDRVELDNTRRQILYDTEDIGKLKVEAAKAHIEARYPSLHIHAVGKWLQDLSPSFFESIDIVLGCVDTIEGRESINQLAIAHSKVYIDGGSMGFGGQVQLIVPHVVLLLPLHSRSLLASIASPVSSPPPPLRKSLYVLSSRVPPSQSIASPTSPPSSGRRSTARSRWMRRRRSICSGCTPTRWSERRPSA